MESTEERDRTRFTRRRMIVATAVATALLLAAGAYALGDAQAGTSAERVADPPRASNVQSTTTLPAVSGVGEPTPTSAASPTSAAPPEPPAPANTSGDRTYTFPLRPATAGRYDPSHHDYPAADIFAECGTEVVAPHPGVVQDVSRDDTWSPAHDTAESRGGLSFSIVGDDGVRYYGSHLETLEPAVRTDQHVEAGQRIGTVGETGNARGTGCHLHFGISMPCGPADVLRRRGEFAPQEYLDAWRRGEQRSPRALTTPLAC